MDENYLAYLNRMARLTMPATYHSQVLHIQDSPKFQPDAGGKRQPVLFPGYTVITPPGEEDPENQSFYEKLTAIQAQLLQQLEPGLLIPVPSTSFHLTLADLIWDSAYRHASQEKPNFEAELRDTIGEIFQQSQAAIASSYEIRWQLLGLIIMPRALGISLLPKDEESYARVIQLRRALYQNQRLIGLGIEQQYGFNAHITLGYFGDIPPELDRDRFCALLTNINQQDLEFPPPELLIKKAELRKFDDMTRYDRQPDWPQLEF